MTFIKIVKIFSFIIDTLIFCAFIYVLFTGKTIDKILLSFILALGIFVTTVLNTFFNKMVINVLLDDENITFCYGDSTEKSFCISDCKFICKTMDKILLDFGNTKITIMKGYPKFVSNIDYSIFTRNVFYNAEF